MSEVYPNSVEADKNKTFSQLGDKPIGIASLHVHALTSMESLYYFCWT